jgi:hypothetical protein
MPIDWHWYDDWQQVLLLTFHRQWTWDELFHVQRASQHERRSERVYVIADLTAMVKASQGSHQAIKALRSDTADQAYVIFVDAPYAMKSLLQLAKATVSLFRTMPFDFADTVAEALARVQTLEDERLDAG